MQNLPQFRFISFPKVDAIATTAERLIEALIITVVFLTMDGLKMKGDAVVEWACSHSLPPPTNNNKIKTGVVAGINDLPESLLVEILIRLRAKYAHRCKSVCKHWNVLISDSSSSSSYFVSQYMRHNKHSLLRSLIFSYSMGVFKTLDNNISKTRRFSLTTFLPCFGPNNNNDDDDDGKEPRVVGSSRGLLLCSTSWHIQIDYYVCNPVTMNWVQLPPPTLPYQVVHVGFICEPYSNKNNNNNSSSKEDELNNRFIVVRIPVVEGILSTFRMEIFSSETSEWRETDVLCPPNGFHLDYPPTKSAVVYNGILHFLGLPSSIFAYDPYNYGDNDSLFRFIDLPEDASYYSENLRLGTSQGCLLLFWKIISFPNGGEEAPIKVWELKDYNTGNWCLAHQVYLSKLLSDSRIALDRLNLFLWLPRVLAFDSNDSDVLYILFGPSTILVGNLRHMTMKLMSGTPDMGDDRSVMCFPIELPCWPTPIPALL